MTLGAIDPFSARAAVLLAKRPPAPPRVCPADCPDAPHRGPQGPNEDLAQCPRCWMPSWSKRPAGETFGAHAPDCSLPVDHISYCVGGGIGHPPAAKQRGYEQPGTRAETLAARLRAMRIRHTTEAQLQAALHDALTGEGWPVAREVTLAPGERIDFLVDGEIGVETKIKGPAGQVQHQLRRYAATGRLRHLILATTRSAHAGITVPDIPFTLVRFPW